MNFRHVLCVRVGVLISRLICALVSLNSFIRVFSLATMQDWLASSARKVSLAGRPMEWLTPLGLPVVQPYHKASSKIVSKNTMDGQSHIISKS